MEKLASFYKDKNVLVTGHTGFKGAWLTEILLRFGAKVTGISKNVPTNPALFELLDHESRISHHMFDLCKKDFQLDLVSANPEIIFHLAAQPLVIPSYEDPVYTHRNNYLSTLNLLETSRQLPSLKALVIVTTDKVYADIPCEYGYLETDPLGGHDPYSASKSACEILTQSYAKSFFQKSINSYDLIFELYSLRLLYFLVRSSIVSLVKESIFISIK